jgi:hypothetical protein
MKNAIKISIRALVSIFVVLMLFAQCDTAASEKVLDENANTDKYGKAESSVDQSETSEITCPECGHSETVILPTDVCMIKYTCEKCQKELTPEVGDCCVFCTYGTHKCPSMQDE